MKQKGFSQLFIVLGIILAIGIAGGVYYFGKSQAHKSQNSEITFQTPQPTFSSTPIPISDGGSKTIAQQMIPVPSNVVTTTLKTEKGYYVENDGKVWVDVGNIQTLVSLYYETTKKLPKSLDEISTLPDLSYAKPMPLNPFNNKPYNYIANQDNSAFMVSGVMHDGVEYKIIVPLQNQ